jgi:hypothetical protein
VRGDKLKTGLDFSAVKISGGGDDDTLSLEQESRPGVFRGEDLEMFNPIDADQTFQITVRDDLDSHEVLKWLTFSAALEPDTWAAEQYGYDFKWLNDHEFNPRYGTAARLAVLIQGGDTWNIVGLPFLGGYKLFACEPEEHHEPAFRYKSTRVLGDFFYHTDGPGPVSWDGASALLEIGEYLVIANGGDKSEPDRIIGTNELDFGLQYLIWIQENSALIIFILSTVKCAWADADLREHFAGSMASLDEILGLRHSLSDQELTSVLSAVMGENLFDKELIRILSSPSHELAPELLRVIDENIERQSAGGLLWRDGLVNYLREIST